MVISDLLALRGAYLEMKRQRRAGPEAQLAHRQEVKADIQAHLPAATADWAPELIVRDMARMDDYPNLDEDWWGISAWFKVEGKGMYHRGLEVFLQVQRITIADGIARPSAGVDNADTRTVFVVGRIPFDAITLIDWTGDDYYPVPHLYCWFDQAEGPYEEVVLYEKMNDGYLRLLDGVRYRPRSRLRAWRDHRALKKAQARFEREMQALTPDG